MKKTVVLLISIIFLFSCKKDNLSIYRNQFSGKWEYVIFVGYPFTSAPLPPGNGKIIVIGLDGSFERRSYDSLIFKGAYFIEEKKDCYGDDKKIFLKTTDPSFLHNFSIDIKGDSLLISSPNCYADGGVSIYRRL